MEEWNKEGKKKKEGTGFNKERKKGKERRGKERRKRDRRLGRKEGRKKK